MLVVCAGVLAVSLRAATDLSPTAIPLAIDSQERLLVVAPHPDDEVLGAGGLMQRVLERGGSVLVVLVTAGDGYVEAVIHATGQPRPRPSVYVAYGKRRIRESRTALRGLGGGRVRLEFLGFPDGGLERLLHLHWQRRHPERSLTTGASDPPYPDALEPDVPYDGADLRRELVDLLRATTPTIVALPDPLDHHPDHSAAGLFTLLALDDWLAQSPARPPTMPRLLAYLVHWPDWPPGWDAPPPPPDTSGGTLELPPNLPLRGLGRTALTLTDEEITAKRAALDAYVTQQEEMAALLAAFVRRTEPFTVLTAADLQHLGKIIERPGPRNGGRGEAGRKNRMRDAS